MAGAQDIFNQVLGGTVPTTPVSPTGASQQIMDQVTGASQQKQQTLGSLTDQKKAALGGGSPDMYKVAAGRESGYGQASAPTELEGDLLSMSDLDLISKYGNQQGLELVRQRGTGQSEFRNDELTPRTGAQVLGDSAMGVAMGVGNTLGGIGSLAFGMASPEAGRWATQQMTDANEWAMEQQSPALAAARRVVQSESEMGYRDNTKQMNDEIAAGMSEWDAGLNRIGRDAMVAFDTNTDNSRVMGDGIAQGVGSLVTAGPIAKGLAALGRVAAPALTRAAAVGERAIEAGHGALLPTASRVAAGAAKHAPILGAIALTESGGAYQQTAQEAYNSLKDRTDLTEEQKQSMANRAGIWAAAVQAPLSAATGRIASGFEANVFARSSLRQIGKNIIREGVEETIQSGTGQLAQNIGLKQEINPNQDLTKGVGEQATVGGLYGLGSAGAIQIPGMVRPIVSAPVKAALAAGRKASDIIDARAAAVTEKNEKASPVSDANIGAAAQEFTENSPVVTAEAAQEINDSADLNQDEKISLNDYFQQLNEAFKFDESELDYLSDASAATVEGSANRVEALQRMSQFVTDEKNHPQDRMDVMNDLNKILSMFNGFIQDGYPEAVSKLPPDSKAYQLVDTVQSIIANLNNTPAYHRATKAMDALVDSAKADGLIKPVDPNTINTPEGQKNVQNHITVAEYAPEKADLDAITEILRHAGKGGVDLDSTKRAALQTASSILTAAKNYDAAAKAQGLRPQDVVGQQIKTDVSRTDEGQYSALQHARRIRSAYDSGNLDAARSYLLDFQQFVQHMQNKVGAYNTHLANWNGQLNKTVNYDALMPDRTWVTSPKGVYVNTGKVASVAFVKQVGLEAQTLTDLANNLSDAFPELNVPHMEHTPLDPLLADGTPQQIVKEFADGTRKVGKQQTVKEQPTQQKEEAKAEPEQSQSKAFSDEDIKAMSDTDLRSALDQADKELSDKFSETSRDNFSRLMDELDARSNTAPVQDNAPSEKQPETNSKDTVTESKPAMNIWAGTNENTEFSNLAVRPFVYEGRRYNSVEHAYQSNKSGAFDAVTYGKYDQNAEGKVRKIAGQMGTDTANSEALMEKLIRASFVQNPDALSRLQEAAENNRFTHTQDKGHWADAFPRILHDVAATATAGRKSQINIKFHFGSLVRPKGGNKFLDSFTFPAKLRSLLVGSNEPIQDVWNTLQNKDHFDQYGYKMNRDIQEAYSVLLGRANGISQVVQQQLDNWAAKRNNAKRFIDNEFATHTVTEGKALNIVENQDGKLVYNANLLQSAVLAAFNWAMNNRTNDVLSDPTEVAKALGVDGQVVTDDMMTAFNNGFMPAVAARSIAQDIVRYWGVRADPNGKIGYTEGIPTAIAGEILEAMLHPDAGLFTMDQFHVSAEMTADGRPRTFNFIRPAEDGILLNNPDLFKIPNAIEMSSLTDPSHPLFLDNSKIPVDKIQLRNPWVTLTDSQQKMVKNAQDQKHFMHMPFVNLITSLDENTVLDLLGEGDLNSKEGIYNVNYLKSLSGRNTSIRSAYNQLKAVLAAAENHAEQAGKDVSEVVHRYKYAVTSVNRLMMVGPQNPQASKLMREAILPTWSVLDMNQKESYSAFMLAMAQAMGVKVHNMSREMATAKAADLMEVTHRDAVAMMEEYHRTGKLPSNFVEVMKSGFKDNRKLASAELAAISEYARLQTTSYEERASFRTPAYVEADGMTNGVINAIALLIYGDFAPSQLANLSRGGVTIGGDETDTANKIRQQDPVDMYEETAKTLKTTAAAFDDQVADLNPKLQVVIKSQMRHLKNLMAMFLPDDVSLNSKGELELKRGVTKNPLTVTLYGSGENGIAAKLMKQITDNIYMQLSLAAERQANDSTLSFAEAMFPGEPQKFTQYAEAMSALTDTVVYYSNKGGFYYETVSHKPNPTANDPVEFTFQNTEMGALISNMRTLFVMPMRGAITETIGATVMNSVDLLRKASQVMSIYLQDAFRREVEKQITWNGANVPDYKRSAFLSQNELDEIRNGLSHLAPIMSTGTQNFFIAGNTSSEIPNSTLSRNLSERVVNVPMQVYGPSDSGVSAVAYLVQGTGDGQMIQNAATSENAPENVLYVYDGMHMALDRLVQDSQTVNKAVYDSWQGNPMKAVSESFNQMMKYAEPAYPTELHGLLISALGLADDTTSPEVIKVLHSLNALIKQVSDSIDQRHAVIDKINIAVDQMAAVGAPHVVGNKIAITGSLDEKAVALNNLLNKSDSKKIDKVITSQSVVVKGTSVRKMSQRGMDNVMKQATPAQKLMYQLLKRTMPKGTFDILIGSRQDLMAYSAERGGNIPDDAFGDNVNGMYDPVSKQIMIFNVTPETLLHEMIHAATIHTLFAYFSNPNGAEFSQAYKDAVKRIETLMNQFMWQNDSNLTPAQIAALNNAKEEIRMHLQKGGVKGRTLAVNEFMSWVLANKNLEEVTRLSKAAKFVQFVQEAFVAVKQLVFGRKRFPEKPGEDIFSNLSFNTAIMLRQDPTVQAQELFSPALQNVRFGDNDRVQTVMEAFDRSVAQYITEGKNMSQEAERRLNVDYARMDSHRLLASVTGHGFTMSKQEASAFTMLTTALQTEIELDPNALNRMQELYTHATKQLTPESFMPETYADYQQAYHYAAEQYDTVMGKNLVTQDGQGRSSMLPVFFGLAMTNDHMRDVLSKLDLPNGMKKSEGTLDSVLETAGQNMMESLSRKMSGETGTNVQEAMDSLAAKLVGQIQDRESFIEQYASTAGGYLDRANDYMIAMLDKLSSKAIDAANNVAANTNNRWTKLAANSARIAASLATERNGAIVAEGVMAGLNRMNGMQPMFDLINDMVGRTDSNSKVYDMIKAVRALVQADRQQYRQHLPTIIDAKFNKEMKEADWTLLHRGLAKTDIASLAQSFTPDEIRNLLSSPKAVEKAIKHLESELAKADPAHADLYRRKAMQLAEYMMNGNPGQNLLRNATAISRLLGEPKQKGFVVKGDDFIKGIDQLTTLYALTKLSLKERVDLGTLADNEEEGINFSLSYLRGQMVEENRKAAQSNRAQMNMYKGYIPSEPQPGVSLIIAQDSEYDKLSKRSYVRMGDYVGSSHEMGKARMGYYFAPVSGRAMFNQGIMQNIRMTAGGVDTTTGFSTQINGGLITDPKLVKEISSRSRYAERGTNLIPVYANNGTVVAYERSVDPTQAARLNQSTHFANNVGVWRGRQVEEIRAHGVNTSLVDNLHAMYEEDIKTPGNEGQYVDVYASGDKVLQDAVKLFTPEIRQYIEEKFGGALMVRRDMLNDAFGYRDATVGDAWTGNSRWSENTLNTVKNAAIAFAGNDAYRWAVNNEKRWQSLMKDARQMIIVKSVVVPVSNAIGNFYQLVSRGVPLLDIARQTPRKLAEIHSYTKSRIRQIEAEAELRAATGVVEQRRLNTEIQSITDSHKRLSIWPLIQAGEFSAINDASLDQDDVDLASGRLYSYIEKKVNQLPGMAKDIGRYALITQDTPLFAALEKSVAYGDFLSKAILYDHLTKRKGQSAEYALSRVTEEYVNYDRLPGRFRGWTDKSGISWFWNFKVRSAKVAMSMLRNNPVHALFGAMMPKPTLFGTIGSPITDNLFTVAADGRLGYSLGIGQAFQAPMLNPWVNIFSN